VLCRLRPGTPSSLVNLEPGPGGTVTTCYRGRQRRFHLDWVFPPDASQEEVTATFAHILNLPQRPLESRRGLFPLPCLFFFFSPQKKGGWLGSSREGSFQRAWEAGLASQLRTKENEPEVTVTAHIDITAEHG
jgi:hypothetical protein